MTAKIQKPGILHSTSDQRHIVIHIVMFNFYCVSTDINRTADSANMQGTIYKIISFLTGLIIWEDN